MSLPFSMVDFVPCDRLLQKAHLLQERNKHVIYRAKSVRMGKNCALGLEYVRPRAQFFPIRTSHLVNNILIFLTLSTASLRAGSLVWVGCHVFIA